MNQNNSQLLVIMKTIWFALLGSQFILIFISFKLFARKSIEEIPNATVLPLFGLGILLLVLSFILPKMLTSGLKIAPTETSYSVLYTPFILTLSLNEACSIVGFVLKIIHNEANHSLIIFTISILIFISRFPTDQKLQNLLSELKNKNFP